MTKVETMFKRRFMSILAPLLASILTLTLPGAALAAKQQQLIDEIFNLSGVDTLFVQIPPLIESTFEQMDAQKVDARIGEVKKIMTQAFAPNKLRSNAVDYISGQLTVNQLEQVRTQLSSPLALKITALENAATETDSTTKMLAYAQQLQTNPPPDARIELIADLINASNAVESSLAVRTEFFRGFLEAASQLDPVQDRMSSEQIDQQISMLRDQMEETTAQEVILAFLYTYQSLEDSELVSYIEIYQNKAMASFTAEINKAIAHSFRAAGKEMMKTMGARLRVS